MIQCGRLIAYPRENTGVCTRRAGHDGVCRNGLAAIESDERAEQREAVRTLIAVWNAFAFVARGGAR